VHGHIEAGESPVETARRELLEEAGLTPLRLYNLSRIESFYRHTTNEVVLVPVFVAMVADDAAIRLSAEHVSYDWLGPAVAAARMSWPRVRREVSDAVTLLGGGDAGPLEDVLLI
jgi:8-oxo-dGTP pyrophosphatase MutT (NUDIX family)